VKNSLFWLAIIASPLAWVNIALAETQVPSLLECSALSTNPGMSKQFTQPINFFFADKVFKAERTVGRPGKEVYLGTVGPNKVIKITGHGAFTDGNKMTWRSEFSGAFKDGAMTEIKGSLHNDAGGHRDCKLTLLMPPEKLATLLFPSETEGGDRVNAQTDSDRTPTQSAAKAALALQSVERDQTAGDAAEHASPFGRRVALVVGNSDYKNVPALPNPQRDAATVAKALENVGFQSVTLQLNLRRDQLVDALRAFAKEAENADWAVVYYAGHGIEAAGINYLIPTDAKITSDRDIALETIPMDQVLSSAERARVLRLVILDACRDNPFADQMKRTQAVASRSISRGLAKMEPDPGTLVVFAAKHGETALDGDGRNSPFAAAFVKDIQVPGVEVRRLFDNVRDDVMDVTGRRQQPYSYGSVPGRQDFYFVSR
jgi:hypothetical protein